MTQRLTRAVALLWAGAAAAGAVHAQDRADIDRTQIVGNRELPKVLTIMPWKKPLPGVLDGRPVNSVLDEALAPLDRAVFRREISYGAQVQAHADAQLAAAKPAPPSLSPDPAAARRAGPTQAPTQAPNGEAR